LQESELFQQIVLADDKLHGRGNLFGNPAVRAGLDLSV
jgi:hypothetical protein